MSKYDIIIIGSGLGGLECGAILSKEGYNVCVFEKNELFGGCFQTYRRKGHLLDTGIHYIGSLDEGQVMNQFFRYVGIMDHLKVRKLDENAFDKIFYKNRVYDYAMGYERFIDTLCQSFPHEKENLRQYTTLLKEVGNLISVDNLKKGIISTEGMKFFNTSAAGMIDKITTNPDLQSVLAGSALLYGGLREHSNFYEHAMINNSYIQGAYRFIDGREKAKQLLEFIKSHGIDFTDHIETMYTTTPLSYRDFTGTCDGSAYGIIKDYKCPQIGFVSTRTKLGNLFLTGQNLNVHGALGVTLTSIITCGELLGHEYLAKRIGHA